MSCFAVCVRIRGRAARWRAPRRLARVRVRSRGRQVVCVPRRGHRIDLAIAFDVGWTVRVRVVGPAAAEPGKAGFGVKKQKKQEQLFLIARRRKGTEFRVRVGSMQSSCAPRFSFSSSLFACLNAENDTFECRETIP